MLYVVSTPIGNMEDITARAVRVLREVDRIACEDTRVTRKLLAAHGIETPMLRHERHNEAASTAGLVALLGEGESIALVSDAGTPAVSDPGERLVQGVIAAGLPVVPIPGPSALLAALVASGLPTTPHTFHGFLPAKAGARGRLLSALGAGTHAFFCPARELRLHLEAVAQIHPEAQVCVARELTKVHENFLRGRAGDLMEGLTDDDLRGEAVLLFHLQAETGDLDDPTLRALLRDEIAAGATPSKAAKDLAERLGIPKRRLYALSLEPDEG